MLDQLLRLKLDKEGYKSVKVSTDTKSAWGLACIIRREDHIEIVLGAMDPAKVNIGFILQTILRELPTFIVRTSRYSWHLDRNSDGIWISECYKESEFYANTERES